MKYPRTSVFPLAVVGLLLAFVLAACTLPTANDESDSETAISGPPVVEIAAPLPNASYLEGVPVVIQAAVSNAGADINRVEIAIDGNTIATQQTPNTAGAPIFSVTETWAAAGVGAHTISIVAFRADGSSSTPATVTINVVDPAPEPTATSTPQPTDTPAPEPTDEPVDDGDDDNGDGSDAGEEPDNEPEVEPTPEDPIARTTSGINVRRGPGTNFEPPIGALAPNTEVEILALNPAGTWLKVRYGLSGEGWIFAALTEIEGDTSSLPRDAGPPPPTAVPPTPIPPTPVPQQANLTISNTEVFIVPPNPVCGQPITLQMTVRNSGSTTTTTGLSRIEVVHPPTGQTIKTSGGQLIPVTLDPGGSHFVEFTYTTDVFIGETHRVRFIADVNNQVNETNENDNIVTVDYTLGACP